MSHPTSSIDSLAVNTIRSLAIDAVQAANSGHPGTPMALAPVTYLLYSELMKYDPADPSWWNRDRFVLSSGHASALLYATLHVAGVKKITPDGVPSPALAVPLEDLKNFRQVGSLCPGHPEFGHTSGVETTTGPLGSGLATSVGLAMAQKWLAERYNRPDGMKLFDYRIFALCGDGDMMEGISSEAASLAAHLRLGNLCWIYDDNGITIEGKTELAFSEDVEARFVAYGWNVQRVSDVNDLDALREAVRNAAKITDRPTLVIVKSVIGFGSPNKAGTADAHGAPLGPDEVRRTRVAYGLEPDAEFVVPEEVTAHFASTAGALGHALHSQWATMFDAYASRYPTETAELRMIFENRLPAGWEHAIPSFDADPKGMASRSSGGKVLNAIAEAIPWLVGGSADLAPSNNTKLAGKGDFLAGSYGGRNFHFGIREHAMAAAANGMALSGLRAFCATFFVFCDYLRPQYRLSALQRLPVLYIMTHDSIGVGEDGPTHQPVEQLAAMRAVPGGIVLRPADANEVAEAWRVAISQKDRPTVLVLSRQNLPTFDRTVYASASGVSRGAYILAEAKGGKPDVILMGTGSEVAVCLEARKSLESEGVATRVVSLPSMELFDEQTAEYRESVLPGSVAVRVAVEAAVEFGWAKYTGTFGRFVGMSSFGASGPAATLAKRFGITPEHVVEEAKAALEESRNAHVRS
ncbi:MAG: transketolase [Planctomycetia bacterium]|nr:transketolase [Planctomycetia bacterium]